MTQASDMRPLVHDGGLQAERTALAWNRSALSLLGVSLGVARLTYDRTPAMAAVLTAVSVTLTFGVVLVSRRRGRQMVDAPAHRTTLDVSNMAAALVGWTVLLGVVGGVLVVL